jgi:tetratricopeptide (TPR) repeat protein
MLQRSCIVTFLWFACQIAHAWPLPPGAEQSDTAQPAPAPSADPAPADAPPADVADKKDPFADAPEGKLSLQKSDRGIRVLSNVSGDRYTFEFVGKDIRNVDLKEESLIFSVDGTLLQSRSVPLAPEMKLTTAHDVLAGHRRYEDDYWMKQGWTEVPPVQPWLFTPSSDSVLTWAIDAPKGDAQARNKDGSTPSSKVIFATTLNGRNVIMMSATIFANTDEQKANKALIDTIFSLVRYEKAAAEEELVNNPGARALFMNSDLVTRKDRKDCKKDGGIVVDPKQLMLVLRLAFEINPRMFGMIFLFDGQKAHVVNIDGYDRDKNEILYDDPWGTEHSFLEEGYNRGGVKATRRKDGSDGCWGVKPDELKNVLYGAFIECQYFRAYSVTADSDQAIHEYDLLRQQFPDDGELKEDRLLKTAAFLNANGETLRAINLYAVCRRLHGDGMRALAAMAAIAAQIGDAEKSVTYYNNAIEGLPDDKSLDAAERTRLAAAWKAARDEVASHPAPKKSPESP